MATILAGPSVPGALAASGACSFSDAAFLTCAYVQSTSLDTDPWGRGRGAGHGGGTAQSMRTPLGEEAWIGVRPSPSGERVGEQAARFKPLTHGGSFRGPASPEEETPREEPGVHGPPEGSGTGLD